MYKLYCRAFQRTFNAGSQIMPWRKPHKLNNYDELVKTLRDKRCKSAMLVTDKTIVTHNLHVDLLDKLTSANIKVAVYDETVANPTVDNIEAALEIYKAENCTAIIALGGGSVMDCAKGIGARATRPRKSIRQMRGLFKVLLPLPTLIAIPTTSGSGSETTVAAVVTDGEEKFALIDLALIPHYVLMLPELTMGLPPFFTVTTGMDALCHAVEAYIGRSNTEQTKADATNAVRLIFDNLPKAFNDGTDLTARANMQEAAFLAGAAFTRVYVGNIHAISHTLSGMYDTPHGLANAVIMPYVLEIYGKAISQPLFELACAVGLANDKTPINVAAKRFIDALWEMNEKMGIPKKIDGIKRADIPLLAQRACKEANPLYPVPVIFTKEDMMVVLLRVSGGAK